MFLAVYAAGGGKRNMANFTRQHGGDGTLFRTADVYLFLSPLNGGAVPGRLHICRFASGRQEWVAKSLDTWNGQTQVKLIPEWFKARFWDNKQEKKHPWFMFALLDAATPSGTPARMFTSQPFPVHQYYPTGSKKTDPNEAACRLALLRVLKQAPPRTLRLDLLSHGGGGAAAATGVVYASGGPEDLELDDSDLSREEPSASAAAAVPLVLSPPPRTPASTPLSSFSSNPLPYMQPRHRVLARDDSLSPPSDATDTSEDSVPMQCEADEGVPPCSPDAYRSQFKNFHVQNPPLYQKLGESGVDAVAVLLSFRSVQGPSR